MAEVIKISLVVSEEDNVFEYHRLLPSSYFDVKPIDIYTIEIDSLREEVKQKHPNLKRYEEYIRIVTLDSETGTKLS